MPVSWEIKEGSKEMRGEGTWIQGSKDEEELTIQIDKVEEGIQGTGNRVQRQGGRKEESLLRGQ